MHKIAEVNEELRGSGQLGAEARVNFAEHRHDLDQQEDGDADGHHGDHDGIHHGGLDLAAQPGGVFQVRGQPGQNFGEQTAFFARPDHADVKLVENLGMFGQRLGKAVAGLPRACRCP